MDTRMEVSLSEHARMRIKERSTLDPETVVKFIVNDATYEAHRENGVSYFVLWSTRDQRPFLAVVQNNVIISFYYTYELHQRKDNCIILPVHIKLAREALKKFLTAQNAPRYHIVVSWEEMSGKGLKWPRWRKLAACPQTEFESFRGTLIEFVASKQDAMTILSQMPIQPNCKASLHIRTSNGTVIASEDLV